MDNVELKDDHSIYNFFYQHPGLLLAIVTAIATGFSFFSDYLYQNIELHYLEYWGYSTNHFHFSISNSSLFVVGVFLFLLYLIVFSFYTSSLTVLHNNFFHIRRWDHRLRLLRKKLDELKIQRHGKKEKAVDKEYDEIAEDISNLQKESCKLKCSTIFSFFFWFLVSLFLIWLLFSFYLSNYIVIYIFLNVNTFFNFFYIFLHFFYFGNYFRKIPKISSGKNTHPIIIASDKIPHIIRAVNPLLALSFLFFFDIVSPLSFITFYFNINKIFTNIRVKLFN